MGNLKWISPKARNNHVYKETTICDREINITLFYENKNFNFVKSSFQ